MRSRTPGSDSSQPSMRPGRDGWEFGDITFNYRLEGDGDTLLLDPVLPQCIKSGCFAAQWAVAVAYPGLAWRRATL